MSIKRTIITTILALALVAMVAPAATQADTLSDLMAQISALQAQIAQLQGGAQAQGAGAQGTGLCVGVTFQTNLKVGSTGQDVKCLQQILTATTSTGYTGVINGYFGVKTLAAVRAFQTNNGLTPANQAGPLTRAKLATLIGGGSVVPPPPGQTGAVSATLALDNPPSGAVVGGQAQADLMHINFTGTGTVTSVTLKRSGISDSSLFDAIYLYDGNTRITGGYSFNSNSQLVMNGLSIAVNGSHVISVRGDVDSGTVACGTGYGISACESTSIITLSGLTANGVAISTNVVGNMMQVASGTLATVTFTSTTATASPSLATINAGSVGQTLWSRTISVSPRAVMLYGLAVKMIGSAPSNTLANVGLYVDGTQIATTTINSNNQYVFSVASPVSLVTGNHNLEVHGDIVAGSSRSFYLSLEQGSDISLRDSQMAVFLTPTYSSASVTNVNGGQMIINGSNGGSVTVAQDPAFNTTTTLVGGASNMTMASFKFSGYGEDEKISSLSFTPKIGGTPTGTTLRSIGLYVNGAQIGSNQTATDTSNGTAGTTLTFNNLGSNLVVPAGSSVIVSIKGDAVTSTGTAFTQGTVEFDLQVGSSNAQGVSSSMFMTTGTPAQSGQQLTIASASSVNTFSTATGFAVSAPAPNQTGVKIGSWVLHTGSSEGLTVNQITVALAGTLVSNNQINNLVVKNGSTGTVLATLGGTPTTTNNLYPTNLTLPMNSALTLDVYADMGGSSNGYAVTPTMTLAYTGSTTLLPTTSSGIAGSQTTVGTSSIAVGGITLLSTANVTTPSQFIAGNGTTRATFKFVATSAPTTVTELKFVVSGSDANPTQTVTNVCIVGTSICRQPQVTSGAQTADLDGLALAVPTGAGQTYEVDFTYSQAGLNKPINPGVSSYAIMTYAKYSTGLTQTSVIPTAAGVTTPTVYIASSVPTVAIAAPTGTVSFSDSATINAAKVTVTAGNAPLQLRQIDFTVGFGGYTNSPTLTQNDTTTYLSSGGTVIAYCHVATLAVTCVFTDTGAYFAANNGSHTGIASDISIPANGSVTFDLYTKLNTAPTGAGRVSESVSLTRTTASTITDITAGGFLWTDPSTGGSTGYGPYNDYKLNDFPKTGVSIANQ